MVTFVGVGDNGFRTLELKIAGPCLVIVGTILVFIRVLVFTFSAGWITKLFRSHEKKKGLSKNVSKERNSEISFGIMYHLKRKFLKGCSL